MLSEDYILRAVQLAVAALLRIAGLRQAGLYDDAQTAIDLALESLLGLRASRARALDDERLYYLLTRDGRLDTGRLALVAALFEAEGDVHADQNRAEAAQAAYARALRYALEVYFQEKGLAGGALEPGGVEPGEMALRISGLLKKARLELLGADTLWPLAGYWEEVGQYGQAEAALRRTAQDPLARPEILPELAEFYRRMVSKPEDELRAGGLDPARARAQLEGGACDAV